ncbi:DivIVA domain-containing protein [Micromonospora inyonensis]|uniref:DivIVA domain-containing protein n=1 Tax=Micromonospora inyonensis TaxID=47866 RepID=A0A1C6RPL8_9ACTN|nr:DivIVA domain-containing protein [Micromonospora inyonensis]SCL19148.1 DivIVA domain-containing protein [Micromonospora inyonensis]
MRIFFRRRSENVGRHHRSPRQRPARGGLYRSASCAPLRPSQVRGRSFGTTRFGRRGLDPAEVDDFLHRVAGDLAGLYAALEQVREENHRIKEALRQWQTRQASRAQNHAGR